MDTTNWKLNGPVYFAAAVVSDGSIRSIEEVIVLVCICIYMYIYMYIYVCIYVHTCMCVKWISVHTYVYICIHVSFLFRVRVFFGWIYKEHRRSYRTGMLSTLPLNP
jgi:hypothetical protein